MNTIQLRRLLEHFYIEDIGDRDLSSELLFPQAVQGEINILAKADGVFCGSPIIETAFRLLDERIETTCIIQEGDFITAGTVVATVKGAVRTLLTGERVVLNLLQRMSGIATATAEIVQLIEGTATRICDTRKTAPGLRMLDKYAIRIGGGVNHRNGLYDAVMLKDNHIAFAGSIQEAVLCVRQSIGHTIKIEVEIESYEQLQQAIDAQADIIMFDNCKPEDIAKWRTTIPSSIVTEASGNITKSTVRAYAEAGVDYISLGALTHSVQAFDFSAVVTIENRTEEVL